MARINRRAFFEESMMAVAAAAASSQLTVAAEDSAVPKPSANETIEHAVIGCRIRGKVHAAEFSKLSGVRVAYVCDPDQQLANELADSVNEKFGHRPKVVQDLRVILDDKSIQTISIAAPNHWHALAAIWGMQAGKDVYVEKPVSHNIVEGRRIVQFANKTKRICQVGTQNRSRGDLAEAAQYIREGKLGEISLARTVVYGGRSSIGKSGTFQPPTHVDFNLWLGPATQQVITRPQFHYDWHWFWDTGNGELGNNNIHYIDIVRWLMDLRGMGDAVVSVGGRVGYEDAGETPNTQMVVHQFGNKTIIQEVRGLKTDPFSAKFKAGHIIHGTEGFIAEGTVFDPEGNVIKTFKGSSGNHFANFIDSVRSRKRNDLRADIVEGHQSTALCHVGNISYRLGKTAAPNSIRETLASYKLHDEVVLSFDRMLTHLEANMVSLDATPLTLGAMLKIDSDRESFGNHGAANALLGREYRAPFVVPSSTDA